MDAGDKQEVPIQQQKALDCVSAIEEAMVQGFPFEVPAQYASLPQLKVRVCESATGNAPRACCRCSPNRPPLRPPARLRQGRATVEFKIKYSEPREDNSTGGTMVAVLDGYNAPVSAGARAGVDLLLLGARAAAARPLLPRSTGPPCFTPPQVTCWTSSSASFTTAWRSSALTGLWCRLAARRTA